MLVRPDSPLLTKFLRPREADVLRAVWEGNHTLSAVQAFVRRDADDTVADDTIAVYLHRLSAQGVLERRRPVAGKRGRFIDDDGQVYMGGAHDGHGGLAYHYHAVAVDESDFVRQQVAQILRAVAEDYPDEVRAAVSEVLV